MKNWIIPCLIFFCSFQTADAQKYFTRNGKITFVASTALETINPVSKGASAVIDAGTGALEFTVLVKGFVFEKALMQEHFNENYMESGKFPRATFKGKILEASTVNWKKDGTYNIKVEGNLTIHGVEKPRTVDATITIAKGKINAVSNFDVVIADHDIKIPSVVQDKIAKVAKVSVDISLAELKK